MTTVIIPAHDEANYIGPCLTALMASGTPTQVIVVANGCTDDTAARAQAVPVPDGSTLRVIEEPTGGKLNALNVAEAGLVPGIRIYLDADVIVSPGLIGQIAQALATPDARYASGTPIIAPATSRITRAYARFWTTLPFVTQGTPGFGIFAVNPAGRARWGSFPDIISDDTYVRLSFAPSERVRVAATYTWPMTEGFANLVRVRRRQDHGVAEIGARHPGLFRNSDHQPVGIGGTLQRLGRDPLGFAVYAAVSLAVKLPVLTTSDRWARGR